MTDANNDLIIHSNGTDNGQSVTVDKTGFNANVTVEDINGVNFNVYDNGAGTLLKIETTIDDTI
jgi:hypothetical protein